MGAEADAAGQDRNITDSRRNIHAAPSSASTVRTKVLANVMK